MHAMMLPAGAVSRDPPPGEKEVVEPGCRFGPLAFTGDDIELGELLGTGAQAQVFRCTRVRSGGHLAVKVVDLRRLRLEADDPQDSIRRLENEVRLLRDVEHERCLGLHDIFRTKKHLFLVMECMEGGELFDQIIKKHRFNEVEARHVFRQVAEGLVFLHSKCIVHRDLKPENVLIASSREAPPPESGTLYEIKIADFGLSKLKKDGLELQSLVGTPQYWAPEVFDKGEYDERVDLWSLGVLLYVMLCGRYPFKGERPNEQIRSGRYDLSSRNWPQVSEEAKDVVRNLLKVDPAQRLPLQDLLRHPWLTGLGEVPRQPAPQSGQPAAAAAPLPFAAPAAVPRESELPLVVVKRDWAEHVVGGGGGSSHAFNLRELMRQQLALAASLEKACLACRHSHPRLSASIRQALCQAHHLSQRALEVVGQYAQTARNVRERLLPDLALAVQEAEPSLAVDLLEVVRGWVQQMHRDGADTHRMCHELSKQLNDLIAQAREDRAMEGVWQEAQPSLPPPSVAPVLPPLAPCPRPEAGEGEPGRRAQELISGLVAFVDKLAMSDGGDGPDDPELCKRDLVDLLFLAPGSGRVLGGDPAGAGEASTAGDPDAMADADSRDPLSATELHADGQAPPQAALLCQQRGAAPAGALPALSVTPKSAGARLLGAHPLWRALQELRHVTAILQECALFWTDLDSTIQELSRFRDQTVCLLRYAAKNARLKERFGERLSEYSAFWGSLRELCESYRGAMQPALQKTFRFINEVESAADAVDAAQHLAMTA